MTESRDCRDCGAKPGDMHVPGCDVERCARCGGQQIGCECVYEVNGLDTDDLEEAHPEIYENGPTEAMYEKFDAAIVALGGRLPWTGEWPGDAECRELGFWCYWGPDYGERGWVRCDKDHVGARADLTRLMMECDWDPKARRYVLRSA